MAPSVQSANIPVITRKSKLNDLYVDISKKYVAHMPEHIIVLYQKSFVFFLLFIKPNNEIPINTVYKTEYTITFSKSSNKIFPKSTIETTIIMLAKITIPRVPIHDSIVLSFLIPSELLFIFSFK